MRTSRKLALLSTLVALPALVVGIGVSHAYAHGWTTSPTSRAGFCADGTATDCGDITWEPQSVEGPKGFPNGGPRDGTLCAGGNERFARLDDPRGGNWPANPVGAGPFSISWNLTAAHATSSFDYYITNDGYDPSQPVTRADLDPQPFLSVPYDGQQPPSNATHEGRLPDRSGRHLILAVWNVADTSNAFYQCVDVDFG